MSVQQRYPTPLDDQRRFFDELITEEWASYRNAGWDYTRRFEVARLLRVVQPRRVLDIGCGCGFHNAELARFDFVERVDAIDYSPRSITKANEQYPAPKVFRRVADFKDDDVEAVYDLVLSFQVFEHLRDPAPYFAYSVRACRPGGIIAIVTPNRNRLDNRIRRWRGEPEVMVDPQHFHEYTTAEIVELAKQHGLVKVDSFAHTFQSLIYPQLTPKNYVWRTRIGSFIPAVASIIGVMFRNPSDMA